MKKTITAALALCLLLGLAACGGGRPEETQTQTSAAPTPITTAEGAQPWQGPAGQEQIKAFFAGHKADMLEMAKLLLRLDMLPVSPDGSTTPPWPPEGSDTRAVDFTIYHSAGFDPATDGFSYPHYTDLAGNEVAFGAATAARIIDYYTVALEETGFHPGIEAKTTWGKRAVSFSFSAMEGGGTIIYMPDGHVRLTYPDPGLSEKINASEFQLAENWYGYYY